MKHIKTFSEKIINENIMYDYMFKRNPDDKHNIFMSKIQDQIENMSKEKKVEFIEKLISEKQKSKGRLWIFSIIPLVASYFIFPVAAPYLFFTYIIVTFFTESPLDDLKEYKKTLIELRDGLKDEIDKTKES